MELKLFLSFFLLLLDGFITRLTQAQLCPSDATAVFTTGDRTINLPLTVPLCIACRFLDDNQGDRIQFNDGVWTLVNGGVTLTNSSFNGNVTITTNVETTAITLTYPDAVVDVGDQLRCTSASVGGNHLITIGSFAFLEPIVTPSGTISVIEGSNINLTCSDPGNSGSLRYIWINDTDETALTPNTNTPPLILTLNNINTTASGVYTCRLRNTNLPDEYMETSVTIIVGIIGIYITQDKTYYYIGDTAIINCTFDGLAANVTWMKDGHLLPHNSPLTLYNGYSLLNLSSLTLADSGCYSCMINSTANSSTCITLEVQGISPTTTTTITNSANSASTTTSLSYSSILSSSMITISPTTNTPTSESTDRTVLYVVSILIALLLLVVIIIILVIVLCFFYRQSKSTEDSHGFVKETSFRIEEFDFQDLEDVDEKKGSLPSTPSHKSTDQLICSDKFEMNEQTKPADENNSMTSSLPVTNNGISSPPPPLPPPYKISDFGRMEEINIGTINVEDERVVYSRVNKPSSIKHPKPDHQTPATPTFNIIDDNNDVLEETIFSTKEEVKMSFPEPTCPPPPVPTRIKDTPSSPTHLDSRPPGKVLYTELYLPLKDPDEEDSATNSSKKNEQEKVIYSDISKLSRSPSGRIVCNTGSVNPLYADLNLIRSQSVSNGSGKEGGDQGSATPTSRTEKVVYAEVDSIIKKVNY